MKDFSKKAIKISVILVVVGIIISLVGFSISGFDYNKLKANPTDKHRWYRTISIE